MLRTLLPTDSDRAQVIRRLVGRSVESEAEIADRVRAIIADVRARGDDAVRSHTETYEGRQLVELELAAADWHAQADTTAGDVKRAIERAHDSIVRFHEPQKATGYQVVDGTSRLELQVAPLGRVGLYVPGGLARYPSSVLMTAVPAVLAGVPEICMVTPGPSAETLYAARVAGVTRVFPIGGAQAVAALAWGTATIPRVDKIVGPGNAWVAEAKRQAYGAVDIDGVAGPSELLVFADDSANPDWIAADLLAQAEHDSSAFPVLVTTSLSLVQQVKRALETQLVDLPRRAIAEKALFRHGVAVVAETLDDAVAFINDFAPEHLEIMLAEPNDVAERIKTAGAIFVGAWGAEAVGDYYAGPNHVLPTGGAARYGSPLGVYDFIKRTSILSYSQDSLVKSAADIARLANVEGLAGHGRSVAVRLKK